MAADELSASWPIPMYVLDQNTVQNTYLIMHLVICFSDYRPITYKNQCR